MSPRVSRRQRFATAGLAAGVLVGVVLDRAAPGLGSPIATDLVGEEGQWYDVGPPVTGRWSASGCRGPGPAYED